MSSSAYAPLVETVFTGSHLDRADNLRTIDGQMDTWLDDSSARVMVLQDSNILIDEYGDLNWLPIRKLKWIPVIEQIFIGLDEGRPRFAASVDNEAAEVLGGRFTDLRELATQKSATQDKPHPDLAIIAQAKSMLNWHESHKHCSRCGHESELARAGYERICPSCGASHFPRTDPVVIMLIVHEESDSVLVGRPPHLQESVYTALAGFMEPGERIEEAVARESYEEAGVTVDKVRYIASQPWPYPSSLMIGCLATTDSLEIKMDEAELEDLVWLSRKQAQHAMEGIHPSVYFPPSIAIARQLVEFWLNEGPLQTAP